MNLRTDRMIRTSYISTRNTPLSYYARVYLNNEYQRWCTWANAKTGRIGRAAEVTRRVYDPLGDYVFKEKILKFAKNGRVELETVQGDVKIFVPQITRRP